MTALTNRKKDNIFLLKNARKCYEKSRNEISVARGVGPQGPQKGGNSIVWPPLRTFSDPPVSVLVTYNWKVFTQRKEPM
jgi:hypothetical protein